MSIYASQNDAPVTAVKLAGAIAKYWAPGKSALKGSPITAGAKAIMSAGFLPIFLSSPGTPGLAAKKMGNVIHAAFLSMPVVGGPHGAGGISSAPKGSLISGIELSYKNNMSHAPHAQKFSKAVHSYTKGSSTWSPNGPPSPLS